MHDVTGELVQLLVKVFEQQCDVRPESPASRERPLTHRRTDER